MNSEQRSPGVFSVDAADTQPGWGLVNFASQWTARCVPIQGLYREPLSGNVLAADGGYAMSQPGRASSGAGKFCPRHAP